MKLLRERRSADEMPFLDHLEELRWRILWSLIALLIGAMVGFAIVHYFGVLELLMRPIRPYLDNDRLAYLSPADPFFITLKLGITVGAILVSPVIVYQIWAFISPALHTHEKRTIVPALCFGVVLFAMGVAMAYFGTLPLALKFLMGFQVDALEQNIVGDAYIRFVVQLMLAFGLAFELPIVMLVLSVLDIVRADTLAKGRRYAVVVATILASLVTPGDIISTFMLGIPLLGLYEVSIVLARVVERRRARREAAAASDTWVADAP